MKKLMTMLAAVGMAFGLFADDPLNNTWDATKDEYPGTLWSGAIDKAKIEGGVLKVATGSDALTREAVAGGTFSNQSNVYFDVELDLLGQALDEVPTISSDAKFGLFVLACNELEGAPLSTTNLFAIGYNDDAPGNKALYSFGDVTKLATTKRITINAYKNVLATGTRAGFTVFFNGVNESATVGTVMSVYWINEDGTVDWSTDHYTAKYLGENIVVANPLLNWYSNQNHNLILGLKEAALGASFTGVDFIGNAEVSAVRITEEKPAFIGPDFVGMTVDADADVTITGTDGYDNGVITKDCVLTVSCSDTSKTLFKVSGYTTGITVDGNQIVVTFAAGKSFHVSAVVPAVEMNGKQYETLAEAINAMTAPATITCVNSVTETINEALAPEEDLTINLNGKTLTFVLGDEVQSVFGNQTIAIMDLTTDKLGKICLTGGDDPFIIKQTDRGNGNVTIEAGIFDARFTFRANGASITGGSFKSENGVAFYLADFVPATTHEYTYAGGYWKVVEASKTWEATVTAAGEGVEITSLKTNNVEVTPAAAGKYTVGDAETVVVTYAIKTGYKQADETALEQTLTKDSHTSKAPTATKESYDINVTVKGSVGGTVSADPVVYSIDEQGAQTINLKAVAAENYKFKQWTLGEKIGVAITSTSSAETALTIAANTIGNIAIEAEFEKDGGVPVDPQDQPQTKTGEENLTLLNMLLGEKAATWAADVYGTDKVPGSKLDKSTPELIAAAAKYNLKVMALPVTVTVGAATDGGFTFTLKDEGGDNPVVLKTLAQNLIKYTASLENGGSFAPSTAATVEATVSDNLAVSAKFTGKDAQDQDAAAGFMKVDLSVEK